MNTIIVLLSLLAVPGLASPEPKFCNGLECPHFTVKRNTSEYQERCYQEYKWASTVVAGKSSIKEITSQALNQGGALGASAPPPLHKSSNMADTNKKGKLIQAL